MSSVPKSGLLLSPIKLSQVETILPSAYEHDMEALVVDSEHRITELQPPTGEGA